MAPPKALITGITGQDGAYLAEHLLKQNYAVWGIHRPSSETQMWRLKSLGIFERVTLIEGDVCQRSLLDQALRQSQPNEIYHLAALTLGGNASFEKPMETLAVNGVAAVQLLESVRQLSPKSKVFLALSGEIFGTAEADALFTESSTPHPLSPYGSAKLLAGQMAKMYRDRHGLFVAGGILFNHESPFRSAHFVTRKISMTVARIALGLDKTLSLGDRSPQRDWGYAPDYVDAMQRMLQTKTPEDFIIATGQTHSVEELAQAAFQSVNLSADPYLTFDSGLNRPIQIRNARVDPSRIREKLGWKAEKNAIDVIKLMTQTDLQNWRRLLHGDTFPWDARLEKKDAIESRPS